MGFNLILGYNLPSLSDYSNIGNPIPTHSIRKKNNGGNLNIDDSQNNFFKKR